MKQRVNATYSLKCDTVLQACHCRHVLANRQW